MSHRDYLLFIDNTPVNQNLKDYFMSFNIDIMQQNSLQPISNNMDLPIAILIHWSILKSQVQTIGQFYARFSAPILVIADQHDEKICVSVLEAGADDFISKPINPRELHARITAINRRVKRETQTDGPKKEVMLFANWRLYVASRRLFNEQHHEILLSAGEYDLILAFAQHPQQVLDREFLLQIAKNDDHNPLDRRIDVQISRLRQKIELDAKNPMLIKTIRNRGYLFTAAVITLNENELDL